MRKISLRWSRILGSTRQQWRYVFIFTTLVFVLLSLYGLFLLLNAEYDDAQIKRIQTLWAITGIIWAITGIISNVSGWKGFFSNRKAQRLLTQQRLMRADSFVDRQTETQQIFEAIKGEEIINLFGRKGSGKSHFLCYICDIANGYRKPQFNLQDSARFDEYKFIYFDLSEALGFEEIVAQIFKGNFPDHSPSWENFVTLIDDLFGREKIALVLDNVNTEGVWRRLGGALYDYQRRRSHDRIILGSIIPIRFFNLATFTIIFEGFDNDAIADMASANGITVDPKKLIELKKRSDGLPLYLRLLFTNWDHQTSAPAGAIGGLRQFISETIIPRLDAKSVDALAGISLCSVVKPEIHESELSRLPFPSDKDILERLKSFSLLVTRRRGNYVIVKLHDLVRDAVLDACASQVETIAPDLARDAVRRGARNEACLFWMFANPDNFEENKVNAMLEEVIRSAGDTKDYPLLMSLSLLANTKSQLKRYFSQNAETHNAILYGRSSALAGAGKYVDALTELETGGAVGFGFDEREAVPSKIEFDLAYLHGDLMHLQNRYDEALITFEHLRRIANSSIFRHKIPRIEWAIGHVLRHQGRDFDASLKHFSAAADFGKEYDDFYSQVFSLTGRLGIDLYLGRLSDDAEADLDELESLIKKRTEYRNYLSEIWKHRAQISFASARTEEARRLIRKAIDFALSLNDRLLFNFYFEEAEFFRFEEEFSLSIERYMCVLDFARENGDRNLMANALLGIIEAEICLNLPVFHRSVGDMRAGALQARAIAEDADIHATRIQAEETLSKIEAGGKDPARLIVF